MFLYRGKSKELGAWVYGYFVLHTNSMGETETYIFEHNELDRGLDIGELKDKYVGAQE